eukprot:764625-Hanusia_phi.AAC.3
MYIPEKLSVLPETSHPPTDWRPAGDLVRSEVLPGEQNHLRRPSPRRVSVVGGLERPCPVAQGRRGESLPFTCG